MVFYAGEMMQNTLIDLSVSKNSQFFEIIISNNLKKIVLLRQEHQSNFRPYIHPLRPMDGSFVITENSPAHHPWQHGLYFGLHGVNGSDFWLDSGDKVGSFQNSKLENIESNHDTVSWCVSTNWVHHNGENLLKEYQSWKLVLLNDEYYLDVQFKLVALQTVTIDQCKYGGLFLRMPWRKDVHAVALNSNGNINKDAEQKIAKWVDITMQWPEHPTAYGFSIFESPKNKGFPNYWRVDGNFGIGPSYVIQNGINLTIDEELTLEYRLQIHEGFLEKTIIDQSFNFFERQIND